MKNEKPSSGYLPETTTSTEINPVIAYTELQVIDPRGERKALDPLVPGQMYIIRIIVSKRHPITGEFADNHNRLDGETIDSIFFSPDEIAVDEHSKSIQVSSSAESAFVDFSFIPGTSNGDYFTFCLDVLCRHIMLSRFRFKLKKAS